MIKSSIQNLKEKIRSRRGIAMELAIIVMLISVAFSLLLTTVLTIQNKKTSDIPNELSEKIAIDQAGEWVLKKADYKNIQSGWVDNTESPKYYYSYDNNQTIKIAVGVDGKTVLTISIDENKDTISSWSYK